MLKPARQFMFLASVYVSTKSQNFTAKSPPADHIPREAAGMLFFPSKAPSAAIPRSTSLRRPAIRFSFWLTDSA